jgi:hypothetical protein
MFVLHRTDPFRYFGHFDNCQGTVPLTSLRLESETPAFYIQLLRKVVANNKLKHH